MRGHVLEQKDFADGEAHAVVGREPQGVRSRLGETDLLLRFGRKHERVARFLAFFYAL